MSNHRLTDILLLRGSNQQTNEVVDFKESKIKGQGPSINDYRKTMTTTTIDSLLNYLFAQNSILTDQLAGVRKNLRISRPKGTITTLRRASTGWWS